MSTAPGEAETARERLVTDAFRIFISSPGGMDEDRLIVTEELTLLTLMANERGEPGMRPIRWPQEFGSGVGDYGQQVINRQADGYDIILCLVGTRVGTPTPRANSGTEEELDIAIEAVLQGRNVQVMVFFNDIPVRPSTVDPYQLMLVRAFQAKVSRLGVLYQTYRSLEELRDRLRVSLPHAHSRLVSGKPPVFRPRSPRRKAPKESLILGDRVFLPQTTAPQWATAFPIPIAAYRGRTIQIKGVFRSKSPYFRFGIKYAGAHEALFSSGSIQTPGQNIFPHIGRNSAGTPLFVTTYRGGLRLGEDQRLDRTEECFDARFRFIIDRHGDISWALLGKSIYRTFFPIDGHPQLHLIAWGDEHAFKCEVSDLRLIIEAE